MSLVFIPIDYYKTKFYQKENNSKKFSELSEKKLSILSEKVYKKQEATMNNQSERISKLERYQKTLQYLTNQYIHLDLPTFDERIAYLIMMTDPNLITFKEFLKIDLISMSEITKIEDEEERNRLKKIRNQTISIYESTVREKIGFFDLKLLKYEELFFKKFFNEKELITEVRNNNQNNFMILAKSLKDFNSISDKRYEELVNIAQTWLSLVTEKYNFKTAVYSITNQKKLLNLTSLAEQLTLFILIIDSNLDMLKIYEEESMMKNIEERIIKQFGFFNIELLILEKKFHNRFCPEQKLSVWSKIKNR